MTLFHEHCPRLLALLLSFRPLLGMSVPIFFSVLSVLFLLTPRQDQDGGWFDSKINGVEKRPRTVSPDVHPPGSFLIQISPDFVGAAINATSIKKALDCGVYLA